MSLFDAGTAGSAPAKCKLVVAYDGTGFHGFAAQPNQRTVGGSLASALHKVLRHEVELTCAGRTDSGVHAWGQVVSFEAMPGLDPWRVQSSLNSMLAPEIVVRSADLVDGSFDARFGATSRHYRYTIVNRPQPDPFRALYSWWIDTPLDLRAMRLAADVFIGEHDFASFCRKRDQAGTTTVRRVLESCWHDLGDGVLRYDITATAFCWQMVRSIVGTLAEVGTGKRRPGDLMAVLRARDRALAGNLAPPHGLCLWDVAY